MLKSHKIIFTLILILTVLTRFFKLGSFPVAPNWDEISHGYNAYSILKTGKDQWGTLFPIFNFRAYGDYPTTLNLYLTVPFVWLFGLNVWSIRLPGAILSVLTVIAVYFLGRYFFKKNFLTLMLMFFTAIAPWIFFPSRAVFQSNTASFFLITGITLLLYSLKNPKLFLVGGLLLGLSAYAYHNTRLIALPLYLIFLFIYKPRLKNRLLFFFPALLMAPSLINLFSPESTARSPWVSIINQGSINLINEKINNFSGFHFLNRLIFNKATYFSFYFIKNYLDFFNPVKLFFTGTTQYQFNIPGRGILFSAWLPFYYLGFISLLKKLFQKNCDVIFLFLWLLLGLLPAAITKGDYPIIRATTILPIPLIFIIFGFDRLVSLCSSQKQKILISIIIIISIIQYTTYLYDYFIIYPKEYSFSWQYGYQQAVAYTRQNYQNYDQVLFTKKYGEPHEFVLFFWPWDPSSYQSDPNKIWDYHASWYWVDAFGKFKFINDWEILSQTKNLTTNTLLVTSPDNYPKTAKVISRINFLNGDPAFDIVSLNHEN
jgi:4-amino-4-deoxy-L-arabinose transferase-like glycosyltransferase